MRESVRGEKKMSSGVSIQKIRQIQKQSGRLKGMGLKEGGIAPGGIC